jgi:hypothetical protein
MAAPVSGICLFVITRKKELLCDKRSHLTLRFLMRKEERKKEDEKDRQTYGNKERENEPKTFSDKLVNALHLK